MRMSRPFPPTITSTSFTAAFTSQFQLNDKKIQRPRLHRQLPCNRADFPTELLSQLGKSRCVRIASSCKDDFNFWFRSKLFDEAKSNTTIGTSDESGISHMSGKCNWFRLVEDVLIWMLMSFFEGDWPHIYTYAFQILQDRSSTICHLSWTWMSIVRLQAQLSWFPIHQSKVLLDNW